MSTVVDGEHPRVGFREKERQAIFEKAEVRSREGTEFRLRLHPYEEAEAKALNRVGNHIAGELSERAVSAWLRHRHVEHQRPNSLMEELEKKLPDIFTGAHGVKLDVKSSYTTPNEYRADAPQTRASTADAIVWCKAVRNGYDPPKEYDTKVHEHAEIWGWTLVADMKNGAALGSDLVVDGVMVRPLGLLLAWLREGWRGLGTTPFQRSGCCCCYVV